MRPEKLAVLESSVGPGEMTDGVPVGEVSDKMNEIKRI